MHSLPVCYVPARIIIIFWYKCVGVVVCSVLPSLSLSHPDPAQVESPSPVARYQSMPVTDSGVMKAVQCLLQGDTLLPCSSANTLVDCSPIFELCISKWLIMHLL